MMAASLKYKQIHLLVANRFWNKETVFMKISDFIAFATIV